MNVMEQNRRLKEILLLMQKNLECAICLELLKNPVSTKCDHQFCRFCITKFFENKRYVPCPLCKVSISKRSLQERPELGNVVERVKELGEAFHSDTSKENRQASHCELRCRASRSLTGSTDAVLPPTKPTKDLNETPCSELDLAEEKDLQKFLSETLAESASKRNKESQKIKDSDDEQRNKKNSSGTRFVKNSNNSSISPFDEKDKVTEVRTENEKAKNNQELLKYLEEGSCGAAWTSHGTPLEKLNPKDDKVDNVIGTCSAAGKENEVAVGICNKKQNMEQPYKIHETVHVAKTLTPFSPCKLKVRTGAMLRNVSSEHSLNKTYPTRSKRSLEEKSCITPKKQNIFQPPAEPVDKIMSPDNESMSSTQQLMKPKPVVSRTYSKEMKSTFKSAGAVRNWVRTLPSPHAAVGDGLKLKGLTTKEKIAAKRVKRTSDNHNVNSSRLVTEERAQFDAIHNSSLHAPDIPLKTRRKSIFKSCTNKTENSPGAGNLEMTQNTNAVCGDEMLDPYEFKGSQTPEGKAKKNVKGGKHSGRGVKHQIVQVISQPREPEQIRRLQPRAPCIKNTTLVKDASTVQVKADLADCVMQKNKKVQFVDRYCLNKTELSSAEMPQIDHHSRVSSQVTDKLESGVACKEISDNTYLEGADKRQAQEKQTKGDKDVNLTRVAHEDMSKGGELTSLQVAQKQKVEIVEPVTMGLAQGTEKKYTKDIEKEKPSQKIYKGSKRSPQSIGKVEYDMNGSIYEDIPEPLKKEFKKRGTKRKHETENVESSSSIGKRTLSRRLRKGDSSVVSETYRKQSEAELAKLAYKINEAEEYDFAFCTQEAHKKMQEEAKQEEYREAFGFDVLSQCAEVQKEVLSKNHGQNTEADEIHEEPKCSQKPDQTSKFGNCPPENVNEADGNIIDQSEHNSKTVKKNIDNVKETTESGNVKHAQDNCTFIQTESYDKLTTACMLKTKPNNTSSGESHVKAGLSNLTSLTKPKTSHYPRPNVSLMVQVLLPSCQGSTIGSTPKPVASAVVLETPVIDQLSQEVKSKYNNNNDDENLPPRMPPSDTPDVVSEIPLINQSLQDFDTLPRHHAGPVSGEATQNDFINMARGDAEVPLESQCFEENSPVSSAATFIIPGNELCADTPGSEKIQDLDERRGKNEGGTNGSPRSALYCATEPEITRQSDILAVDTCPLETNEIDSCDTPLNTVKNDKIQLSTKRTNFVVEESQGTDLITDTGAPRYANIPREPKRKVAVPKKIDNTTKEVASIILDSGDPVLPRTSIEDVQKKVSPRPKEILSQESCIIVYAADHLHTLALEKNTLNEDEDTASMTSFLSQSVLSTKRNTALTPTKSSKTSSSSSDSNGIVPPTAQKEPFTVDPDTEIDNDNQLADGADVLQESEVRDVQQSRSPCSHPKMNNTPDRVSASGSENDDEEEDEDDVLMVRRPKKLCFSLDDGTVEPVKYKSSSSHIETQPVVEKHVIEGTEMVGETQALDVLETDSQDVKNCTQETNEVIAETECESEIEPKTDKEKVLVEVTPVGEVRYIEGVGRCFVGLDNSHFHPDFQQITVHESHKQKSEINPLGRESSNTTEQTSEKQSEEEVKCKGDNNLDCLVADEKEIPREINNVPVPASVVSIPSRKESSKKEECNGICDPNLSLVSAKLDKTKRTRRGLAAKIANGEVGTPELSDRAKLAICKSVKETKSKLESLNKSENKSSSKPVAEIIDLEAETEETKSRNPEVLTVGLPTGEKERKKPSPGLKNGECIAKSAQDKCKKNYLESDTPVGKDCGKSKLYCSLNLPNSDQRKAEADQVMSDLKACFVSSSDESSEDEDQSEPSAAGKNALEAAPVCEQNEDVGHGNSGGSVRACPTPLSSSPLDGIQTKSQHGVLEQSVITGQLERVAESDDDLDTDNEEEEICAAVKGKKRLRQQITSDSDDESDEEQSQSKSSVSSVLSSQAEVLSTQQAKALEGDVDKLQKEIAIYEAKLGAFPVLDSANNDSDGDDYKDAEEEDESDKNVDSASLCKRLPDVFVIDESPCTASKPETAEDESETSDDLFVSPLSPSPPPQKESKMKPPPAKRPKKAESLTHPSEHFLKQFQSPGGTVRTKKQLDFVQSSLNNFVTRSGTTSETKDFGKEEGDILLRPLSPVLSSQKNKSHQGSKAKDAGLKNVTITSNDQKICFVTSGLTREDNATALAFAKKLGAAFNSKFSKEVTHVVMKTESDQSRVCERTLKFFQGVAHKCWVVAFSWIESSLSVNRLLPEIGFEITGDTSAGEFAGGAGLSRESNQPLFSDFCFACVGSSEEMPKESLCDLLTVCGATCVEDPIALLSKVVKHKVIVRCSDSDVEPSGAELDMFNGMYKHMGFVTLMREWILDSLGSYSLLPMAGYVLNTVTNVQVPF